MAETTLGMSEVTVLDKGDRKASLKANIQGDMRSGLLAKIIK
jgi:hypothetical protein